MSKACERTVVSLFTATQELARLNTEIGHTGVEVGAQWQVLPMLTGCLVLVVVEKETTGDYPLKNI